MVRMSEVYLSKLAANNAKWLSIRQSLIAGNIANANSPKFKTVDVRAFDEALNSTGLQATRTHPSHKTIATGNVSGVRTKAGVSWDTYHSGGNVSLPHEMIKAGEVATAYKLNTSVMKSFHRMLITTFGM